jgi:hypothetical protein
MLYSSVFSNRWKWMFLGLTPGVFFICWKLFVKPHEIKRLQVEAVQTADRIVEDFSGRSFENLALVEALFLQLEHESYDSQSILIDDLNVHFKKIQGLELFVLPRIGDDSSLVLFNPYVMYSDENGIKDVCAEALIKYPKRFKQYKKFQLCLLMEHFVYTIHHFMRLRF